MFKINNEISKSNITFITIQNKSVLVHVCFVLFTVCLYICVCERLLQNNNHKTKHKNDNNCGSAFEVGASGLPYYCVSICVRSWYNWRANCVDSKPKKEQKVGALIWLLWREEKDIETRPACPGDLLQNSVFLLCCYFPRFLSQVWLRGVREVGHCTKCDWGTEISPNDGYGCTQGSFLERMHARIVLDTNARHQKDHFDGCTQRTFGQRMRTRYEANPECAQPTSRAGNLSNP